MPNALRITSAPFAPNDPIPREHTCEGEDVSPALDWTGVPDGAESLVLIVDDPDAPGQTFTHWVLFNLPPNTTHLPRGVDVSAAFAGTSPTAKHGTNDFGDVDYGGPCPPPGDGPHRYFFRLYALDTTLDLDRGAAKAQIANTMKDHVLADTDRVGTYER